ncbi:DUF3696 domain-containing protein [Escherichia coli]|uniref:DUF3696 domain-containing protein n=3 Tax=Escherichia coli TaxID=562 RepID=UPI000A3C15AD|nr:DUF3696 domain-containing protein [Escherichia coli]OUK88038.1 hypothetical protein BZL70_25745 [Escherichia coli]
MMSLWDALRMNMMISYQELVRTFLRQTTDNELPESNYPVKPDFISVIVFEDNNGSTVTRKIDITDDGDFKQKWPKGFFEERRGELF